jgi:hypothetical protein
MECKVFFAPNSLSHRAIRGAGKENVMMDIIKRSCLFVAGILFLACSGSPIPVSATPASADELDAAIRETSNYLNQQLPKRNKLVILNVQSDFPALSEYIIDELIANTVNDRIFSVVDRRQLDTIRAELDFQYSGEVDDDTMQALGRMAGAQIIISGAVSKIGDLYRLRVRALSVQTASIEGQFNRNIPEGSTIAALVRSRATGYGGASGTARTQPASASTLAGSTGTAASGAGSGMSDSAQAIAIEVTAKSGGKLYFQDREIANLWENETHTIAIEGPGTYALKMVFADHTETRSVAITARGIVRVAFGGVYTAGQAGPAGGIVFFDKGSYSDGWRYLEAASADIPGTAEWGAKDRNVGGTNTGRGAGKRNTQIIADYLRDSGETGRAAQVVLDYRQGGYDDWFLPSKDELNLMYENLKAKGLGRFRDGSSGYSFYWSSSQSTSERAWVQNFVNGRQEDYSGWDGSGRKDKACPVRAVRAF